MKTLYILRHAQKDTSSNEEFDYDVKLTSQGEEEAKQIGKILKKKGIMPDLFVSSPAIRARTTSEIIAKEIEYPKNIMYNEVIYNAFLHELIESISYTYDSVETLLVVGHNPSLTALSIYFTSYKEELKMANAIRIDFDCNSWIDIDKTNAKFVELIEI